VIRGEGRHNRGDLTPKLRVLEDRRLVWPSALGWATMQPPLVWWERRPWETSRDRRGDCGGLATWFRDAVAAWRHGSWTREWWWKAMVLMASQASAVIKSFQMPLSIYSENISLLCFQSLQFFKKTKKPGSTTLSISSTFANRHIKKFPVRFSFLYLPMLGSRFWNWRMPLSSLYCIWPLALLSLFDLTSAHKRNNLLYLIMSINYKHLKLRIAHGLESKK
jgi:hypothetical protein